MNSENQQTLATKVSCTGIGLHSGSNVTMNLLPAKENSGICFVRKDIDSFNPVVKADYRNVSSTNLGTAVSNDDGTIVSTIEHIMAAFWGCGIDNAIVELDAAEVPIMDGSAEPFVFLIECSGIKKQHAKRKVIEVLKKVSVEKDGACVYVEPSKNFSVSLEIDYGENVISNQKAIFHSSNVSFKTDLCRARTFGFEHEVSKMRSLGLAKGGSLENAIVVGKNGILNKGGLRYGNEFVKHKILDCIGDFYLMGASLKGHFFGYHSGHALNNTLLRKFFSDKSAWRIASSTS